jgi:two-component system phosphate regulon sensor histidine kinase PhoR
MIPPSPLTRLENGTADLLRRPFDLAPVLQNVLDKFGIQAQHAQITLQGNIHPPLNTIGDGDRLAQVFTNLVDNALKFTPAGGQVILTASASANGITVCVSDTGPGISPNHQARIFERFYQVDRSRRGGSGRGVGLGLAIARQIVVAHGGKIWVESAPGKGSQFFVKLPAHQG